jgi:hypothetical protein
MSEITTEALEEVAKKALLDEEGGEVTEEEAKTKWCCQSQATENPFKCDGSACMAWRWEPVPPRYEGTALVFTHPPVSPTDGYCGLAGKP